MRLYFVRAIGGSGMGGFIEDGPTREFVFSAIALVIAILHAAGARSLSVGTPSG